MGFVSYGNWNNARAVLGAVPFNWVKFLMYGRMCFYKIILFPKTSVCIIVIIPKIINRKICLVYRKSCFFVTENICGLLKTLCITFSLQEN